MSNPPAPPRLNRPWSRSDRLVPRRFVQPVQQFLHTEVAGGVVLLVSAVVALVWANSPWSGSYTQLWHTELAVQLGGFSLGGDLHHWVNDLAMALFFFVAGLEIKRELVHGELGSVRAAALPIACAIGGMVVPAAIFATLTAGGPGARGWGVPMATDIAFSVGVLSLVGRRTPAALKLFLLTLAIVDDIGAIVVIALFYSSSFTLLWFLVGVGVVLVIVALQVLHVRSLVVFVVLAGVLWLAAYRSGVHATIAGVILGLLTPARPFHRPTDVQHTAVQALSAGHLLDGDVADEQDETTFLEVASLTTEAVSPLARLERRLHPWSSFLVLPLFALANAGIALSPDSVGAAAGSRVTLGVVAGLVLGKPLGILVAAVIVVKLARVRLPAGVGWVEMAGVGALAGIGFTVSMFIAGLAFEGPIAEDAKIGIIAASVLAGAIGAGLLVLRPTADPLVPADPADRAG